MLYINHVPLLRLYEWMFEEVKFYIYQVVKNI